MGTLICLGLTLLGFVLGYFLQTTVLLVLSAIFIIAGISMMAKAREIEKMIAMLFVSCFIIASSTMWITWYFVNKQTFVQDFLNNHIFR